MGLHGFSVDCFTKRIQFWLHGPGFLLLSSDKWLESDSILPSSETVVIMSDENQLTVQSSAIYTI